MAKDTIAASVPLYTAVVESDAGNLNLIVTVDGVDHDVNLGNPYDADAEQWEQIGRLWVAAPLLLAVCKELVYQLGATWEAEGCTCLEEGLPGPCWTCQAISAIAEGNVALAAVRGE